MTVDPFAQALLISWRRNGAYALRLVGDLTDAQMLAQPVAGVMMNHPAWALSHLNVYAPIAAAMLRRHEFQDPLEARHGQKSTVSSDAREYPGREELIEEYRLRHADVERALEEADGAVFLEANPLARWREMHPTIGAMAVTLLVKHESTHLGQISAWRRAMGLAPVGV